MVFSFFKKKDQTDELPVERSYKQPAGMEPVPATAAGDEEDHLLDSNTLGTGLIEVNEAAEGMDPVVEEAAILFASEQAHMAIELLEAYLSDHAASGGDESWLSLFELYQQTGARTLFDELAIKYVVRFECTAPIWQETQAAAVQNPQSTARSNYFAFAGPVAVDSPRIAELNGLAKCGGKIRLDFGKFEALEPEAAQLLMLAMQACRKGKSPLQLVGGNILTDWLAAHIEMMRKVDAEMPYWLLLMELHQQQGQLEAFENLAVDYAVTYEVSPPSWESIDSQSSMTLSDAEDEPAAGSELPARTDVLSLQGAITDKNAGQLQAITDYSQCHHSVVIDASRLARVDFISAGNLLNVLMPIVSAGKPVVFDQVNILIHTLFRIMGITDLATVKRKK
ncbi:STAS domain-containing protein [Chitinivorax sp. PXF-14]|uniref:STAS domain-containing protein n=1 Tax=Chitinivorax sp. PXF-14 TaxID=3230488 RepID=UPI003466EA34